MKCAYRTTFPACRFDEFMDWCSMNRIEAYRVDRNYAVADVKINAWPNNYYVSIYKRLNDTDNLTIDHRLKNILYRFLYDTKSIRKENV